MKNSGRHLNLRYILIVTGIFFILPVHALHFTSFQGLGDLPGGRYYSSAADVSADGTVIVGASSSTKSTEVLSEAFRWDDANGMSGLGILPDRDGSQATGVSADGSVIVGSVSISLATNEAFRYDSTNGMIGLGDLPGGAFASYASAISADGSVIVGTGQSENGTEAMRYDIINGMVGLGDLSGSIFYSNARGVTADGTLIVGGSSSINGPFPGTEMFRYEITSGMIGLGDLPGGGFYDLSEANDLTPDGSIIVGRGQSDNGVEAVRYDSINGMVGLGDLPGGRFFSIAFGISGDGTIIVGMASTDTNRSNDRVAFVWQNEIGMQSLKQLILDSGITEVLDWQLESANAISTDGSTIVGRGFNPNGDLEAFVAKIGDPPVAVPFPNYTYWLLLFLLGFILLYLARKPLNVKSL